MKKTITFFAIALCINANAQKKLWLSRVTSNGSVTVEEKKSGGLNGAATYVFIDGQQIANRFFKDLTEQLQATGFGLTSWKMPMNVVRSYSDSVARAFIDKQKSTKLGKGREADKQKQRDKQEKKDANQEQRQADQLKKQEEAIAKLPPEQQEAVRKMLQAQQSPLVQQKRDSMAAVINKKNDQTMANQKAQQDDNQTNAATDYQGKPLSFTLTFLQDNAENRAINHFGSSQNEQKLNGGQKVSGPVGLPCVQNDYTKNTNGQVGDVNEKEFEALQSAIFKKCGYNVNLVVNIRVNKRKDKKDLDEVVLSAKIQVYDSQSKLVATIYVNEKKNDDVVWDNAQKVAPASIISELPDMITAFAKKCAGEIKSQLN